MIMQESSNAFCVDDNDDHKDIPATTPVIQQSHTLVNKEDMPDVLPSSLPQQHAPVDDVDQQEPEESGAPVTTHRTGSYINYLFNAWYEDKDGDDNTSTRSNSVIAAVMTKNHGKDESSLVTSSLTSTGNNLGIPSTVTRNQSIQSTLSSSSSRYSYKDKTASFATFPSFSTLSSSIVSSKQTDNDDDKQGEKSSTRQARPGSYINHLFGAWYTTADDTDNDDAKTINDEPENVEQEQQPEPTATTQSERMVDYFFSSFTSFDSNNSINTNSGMTTTNNANGVDDTTTATPDQEKVTRSPSFVDYLLGSLGYNDNDNGEHHETSDDWDEIMFSDQQQHQHNVTATATTSSTSMQPPPRRIPIHRGASPTPASLVKEDKNMMIHNGEINNDDINDLLDDDDDDAPNSNEWPYHRSGGRHKAELLPNNNHPETYNNVNHNHKKVLPPLVLDHCDSLVISKCPHHQHHRKEVLQPQSPPLDHPETESSLSEINDNKKKVLDHCDSLVISKCPHLHHPKNKNNNNHRVMPPVLDHSDSLVISKCPHYHRKEVHQPSPPPQPPSNQPESTSSSSINSSNNNHRVLPPVLDHCDSLVISNCPHHHRRHYRKEQKQQQLLPAPNQEEEEMPLSSASTTTSLPGERLMTALDDNCEINSFDNARDSIALSKCPQRQQLHTTNKSLGNDDDDDDESALFSATTSSSSSAGSFGIKDSLVISKCKREETI